MADSETFKFGIMELILKKCNNEHVYIVPCAVIVAQHTANKS